MVPPPAPLPMIATSASRVRSWVSCAPLWVFQPRAMPSRNGSGTGIFEVSFYCWRARCKCGSLLAMGATRSQTVGGPGYPQCAHDSLRPYQAIITSCTNELWPMRSRLNELFSQRSRKCRISSAAGVFPAAPDPGQRPAGDGHAQHVEQLSGELEHFRGQMIEVVIEAFQGALDSAGHVLGAPRRPRAAPGQGRAETPGRHCAAP